MDILKRSISNITDEAWSEIDEQVARVLRSNLSARKFVDISGPFGWDYAAHSLGRIEVPEGNKEKVTFGIHKVMPLTEVRVMFDLNTWELDNITRGSKDPDLSELETASREIAFFEEKAVYKGFEQGCIAGISPVADNNSMEGSRDSLMEVLSRACRKMGQNSVEGPYALVADEELWTYIYSKSAGYPLSRSVTSIIDGGIILSPSIEGSYLVSLRGGDMEMVLGQDYSVGYQSRNKETVTLFITESFTFRLINPEAVIPLKLS